MWRDSVARKKACFIIQKLRKNSCRSFAICDFLQPLSTLFVTNRLCNDLLPKKAYLLDNMNIRQEGAGVEPKCPDCVKSTVTTGI